MNVVVLYDAGADDWSPEDIRAVRASVTEVSDALERTGHRSRQVAVRDDFEWFDAVRRADLVFNLCEGVGGVSRREYQVGSAIELAGVPTTGVDAWTMMLCHRKPLANAWLAAAGLPVPPWGIATVETVPPEVPLPAIIKPAEEDASVGIGQDSVVTTRRELEDRATAAAERFGEVIVQRYVEGREIATAFVADHVLPLSEIDFGTMPDGAWPIVSFAGKWHVESAEYGGTRPVCPAPVAPAVAERILAVATAAWRAVRGWGYGRVDLRVDHEGAPWVLEVNPNPDISTDAGLVRMARAYGWGFDELINRIIQAALHRPASAVWGQAWETPAAAGAQEGPA